MLDAQRRLMKTIPIEIPEGSLKVFGFSFPLSSYRRFQFDGHLVGQSITYVFIDGSMLFLSEIKVYDAEHAPYDHVAFYELGFYQPNSRIGNIIIDRDGQIIKAEMF